ncbi:TraE/TraK family type IV conjugative transfer system protein [Coxiella endosymbiont of Ornithodoros maritimus]|uniref:TraE/TraK family type IV conjugative transfer system protein n=1 Tax=Coxiella endosymbiont of Ornithodoros maritimus TaxID=1656172 RepID=UPI002264C6D1|nr:TraE/TraK family type IV conjugative transfer system protein [Coxiella endosymbiont of Ornithodoros maritimus]
MTPETVLSSNQALLCFLDSQFYANFKKQLSFDANVIKDGKIASIFYVKGVHTYPRNLIVMIEGELKRWVGERLIRSESKRYRFLIKLFQQALAFCLIFLSSFPSLTSLTSFTMSLSKPMLLIIFIL